MQLKKSFIEYSIGDLIFDLGLYKNINIDTSYVEKEMDYSEYGDNNISYFVYTSEEFRKLIEFIKEPKVVHGYCPYCKKEHTFDLSPIRMSETLGNSVVFFRNYMGVDPSEDEGLDFSIRDSFNNKINELKEFKYFFKTASCKLKSSDQILVAFCVDIITSGDNHTIKLKKVGQNPSIAEFYNDKYKKYKKYLDTINCYHDYTYSHYAYACGQGISAYAYIRRVLENIIISIYREFKASLQTQIQEDAFIKIPMTNKFKELNKYLPEHLKNNQIIYDLLSVGIHPILNEEECMDGFPIISQAIDYIIEEEIHRKDKGITKKNMKMNSKAINGLYKSVKQKR